MGHNLNFNEQSRRHAFVSVKEVAWHGLGKVVNNSLTSRECIEEALLDYEVGKGKVYVKYDEPLIKPDGTPLRGRLLEDKYITYRADNGTPFNVVGSTYEVIQNREAFSFFDNIVGENRAIYETAGALGNGETIFITAKLPHHMLIGGKDTIDQYLLLTMSHDGLASIIAKFTPIRVVCNNTLSAALGSGKNVFKIRHTSSARDRMKEAEQLLAITYKTSKETQEIYEHLTKIKITDEQKEQFFLDMFLTSDELFKLAKTEEAWWTTNDLSTRKKNQLVKLFEYDQRGAGQQLDICKGTAYGAYNAITGYIQNVKSFGDDEKKFSSIMNGGDDKFLSTALNKVLELS